MYNQFYSVSDIEGSEKHYVAHGSVVETAGDRTHVDDHHENFRVVEILLDDIYEYVTAYLRDAGFADE